MFIKAVNGMIRVDGRAVGYIASTPATGGHRFIKARVYLVWFTAADRILGQLLTAYIVWKAVRRG